MAEERFIITHEDGRTYSVTEAGFRDFYEAQGFTIERPETPADSVPDVPRPARRRRSRPRHSPAPAFVPAPADESETEPET
jgi:hypothetical protein